MKENLSKKSSNFGPTRNFAKCPKLAREAPRAIQKIKKKMGPKGPGPNFGPRVPLKSCNIVSAYGIEATSWGHFCVSPIGQLPIKPPLRAHGGRFFIMGANFGNGGEGEGGSRGCYLTWPGWASEKKNNKAPDIPGGSQIPKIIPKCWVSDTRHPKRVQNPKINSEILGFGHQTSQKGPKPQN